MNIKPKHKDLAVLLSKLSRLERLARASKMQRLFHTPARYIFAIVFRKIIYPITGKELRWFTRLFWGHRVCIALPASADIFLLGCKTDDSEIRLTRFILKNLGEGDFFVDVGSHVGYYSLLSSFCVGEKGRVVSVEASTASFYLLKKSVSKHNNIEPFHIALSDKEEAIRFFEFRGQFAEYNTMNPEPFEKQSWY